MLFVLCLCHAVAAEVLFHVAPMQCYTNVHLRVLLRSLSAKAVLWTEMEKDADLLASEKACALRLRHTPAEQPLVLQLGGNNPLRMARVAQTLGGNNLSGQGGRRRRRVGGRRGGGGGRRRRRGRGRAQRREGAAGRRLPALDGAVDAARNLGQGRRALRGAPPRARRARAAAAHRALGPIA
jgi:hypothetical protein